MPTICTRLHASSSASPGDQASVLSLQTSDIRLFSAAAIHARYKFIAMSELKPDPKLDLELKLWL